MAEWDAMLDLAGFVEVAGMHRQADCVDDIPY
jgi:hypothetical protein